jgi:hypothetical protein
LVVLVPLTLDVAGLMLQKRGIDVWARIKDKLRRKK